MTKSRSVGIRNFPATQDFWRVVGFGGVTWNSRATSDPRIEVFLTSVLKGGQSNLTPDMLIAKTERIVQIPVGMLPYVPILSCWQNRRPVPVDLAPYQRDLDLDVYGATVFAVDDLYRQHQVLPPAAYSFAGHWSAASQTRMVAVPVGNDPFGVLIPVMEILRFYYAPSTRLAQALFLGEYHSAYDHTRSGQVGDGTYRIHLASTKDIHDAWIVARYSANPRMQAQVRGLYQGFQAFVVNRLGATAEPFRALAINFPFVGKTRLRTIGVPLPGPDGRERFLALRLQTCSAPFPYRDLICTTGPDKPVDTDATVPAQTERVRRLIRAESGVLPGGDTEALFADSQEEPARAISEFAVVLHEDRFSYLAGRSLIVPPKDDAAMPTPQIVVAANPPISGLSTGEGVWGPRTRRQLRFRTNVIPAHAIEPESMQPEAIPESLKEFSDALLQVIADLGCPARYVVRNGHDLKLSLQPRCLQFPTHATSREPFYWALLPTEAGMRPRRLMLVELTYLGRYVYLAEAEQFESNLATLAIVPLRPGRIASSRWQTFLRETAKRAAWQQESEMPDCRRERTTHSGLPGTLARAERIRRCVERALGL